MAYERMTSAASPTTAGATAIATMAGAMVESDDRRFIDRAGDEVRSWFGDEDARATATRPRPDRAERERRPSSIATSTSATTAAPIMAAATRRRLRRTSARCTTTVSSAADGGEDRNRGFDGNARSRPAVREPASSTAPATRSARGSATRMREHRREMEPRRDDATATSCASDDAIISAGGDRQIDELDRDYDDYRRENSRASKTNSAAGATSASGKRGSLGQVREHMEVVGIDGEHVGTVDKVARRPHHPDQVATPDSRRPAPFDQLLGLIDRVEDDKCHARLTRPTRRAAVARRRAAAARCSSATTSGERARDVLDRSFSGTYR